MKEIEAIKTLDAMKKQFLPPTRDILDMAIKALEKQIPKKPNKAIDSSWGIKREVPVCPVCDYYLTEVHWLVVDGATESGKVTYCDTCGQAIDWE